MFVVDASVILAWCLNDEASEAAESMVDRLLSEGAIAPAHWPLEVANGLRMAERRQRLDEGAIDALATRLGALPVDVIPVDLGAALGSIEVARSQSLTVYDASYLNLANLRGLGLATVDDRLAEAGRGAGISLIA
jgi:predicted nucleic acid-binding protein